MIDRLLKYDIKRGLKSHYLAISDREISRENTPLMGVALCRMMALVFETRKPPTETLIKIIRLNLIQLKINHHSGTTFAAFVNSLP